jgi:hypothetical protein
MIQTIQSIKGDGAEREICLPPAGHNAGWANWILQKAMTAVWWKLTRVSGVGADGAG